MAAKKKADAAVENTAEVTQESVQEEIEQVAADNAKELDNKKYVVDHLLSTKREGMEDLIAYMEEIGFFEAPCSGGNHLACQFGLCSSQQKRDDGSRKHWLCTSWQGQVCRNP